MYIQKSLRGREKYTRSGEITELSIDKSLDKANISVNPKLKRMKMIGGEGTYCLCDKFAVGASAELTVIMLDDCMLLEVTKGTIYLEDNADIYIGTKHKSSNLKWYDYASMLDMCQWMTSLKYEISLKGTEDVSNFALAIAFTYNHRELLAGARLLELSDALGVGKKYPVVIREEVDIPFTKPSNRRGGHSKSSNSYKSPYKETKDVI